MLQFPDPTPVDHHLHVVVVAPFLAVRAHHNSRNLPMIAIDRKLGYVQTPGTWLL